MKDDPAILERSAPIDLAREAPFALGAAAIRPSLSEVVADGQTIRLQPRVMQVLVALVRANGEVVSRDDLVASCWGGLIIGDDAINRCIGRLRRLAEDEAPASFTIETLTRIGYRLTPTGGVEGAISPPRRRRPPPWGLAVSALILLGLAGGWVALGRPGWPQPDEGVAVMPFDTAPGDPFSRSFADGLADEIASTLAKADLKSLPSEALGGSTSLERDAAAIRLGAAYTLGGRVQRDGQALNVSVAIDDAQRHEILWSADFSRPGAEAQAMQEQVAARVADVLHCALDAGNFEGGRIDRDTLRLYLRACEDIEGDDPEEVRDLFRQVVAREPRFANAWAGFALASALASQDLPPNQAVIAAGEARSAADRALQIDPRSGLAYVALSLLAPGPGHLLERQSLLLKGLAVSPDTAPLNYRESELLGQAGRHEEAIAFERRAVMINPIGPGLTASLAGDLASGGRLAEARTLIERAARIWPDDDSVRAVHIGLESRFGDPARALALLDDQKSRPSNWEEPTVDDWRRFSLMRQSHDPAKVAAYTADILAQLAVGKMGVGDAVRRLTPLGATDAAFAAAGRSSPADTLDTEVLFRPSADAMRRDPRFMPLAAKLGLVDFWKRTGHWPDFCAAPDRPYDCRAVAARLSP